MSHATLVVDGQTRMDEELDLSDWQRPPPEFLANLIKPGAKPEPYLQCAAIALVTGSMGQRSVTVEVHTHTDGWTLRVEHQ